MAARLVRDGLPVIAPANPLRSGSADSACLASILATISGPVVLAVHPYGGIVITNAAIGNANVRALVYVAALVEAVYDDIPLQQGFAAFVPVHPGRGPMFGSAARVGRPEDTIAPVASEDELYTPDSGR